MLKKEDSQMGHGPGSHKIGLHTGNGQKLDKTSAALSIIILLAVGSKENRPRLRTVKIIRDKRSIIRITSSLPRFYVKISVYRLVWRSM